MKTLARRELAALALALLVALPLACPPRPVQNSRITVGVSALRISLPVFVAIEQGIFRWYGLDVEARVFETAQPMVDDVVAGRVDAGGFAAYPIVMLGSRGAARPPRVAASLLEDQEHRLSYVLARRGSALRFPRDVRGRVVGILPTVAYQRWLAAILRAENIGPDEVSVVPVQPALQAQTLAAGGVDFLFTNDPMATAILARNVGVIADDGPPCAQRLGEPFAFGTFVVSGALAEDRPEVAARVVAAIDEAIARVRSDPAAARSAMAKYLRPEERAFVHRYPAARYLTSREAGAATLQREVQRERDLGILTAVPAVLPWSPPATAPTPAPLPAPSADR